MHRGLAEVGVTKAVGGRGFAGEVRVSAPAGAGVVAAMALVGFGVLLGGGGLGLGIGDGKLIILMGAMIGWPGVFPAVVYGILLGGLVAVVMLVRHGRGATFSYGPYLAAGAALALLFPSLR